MNGKINVDIKSIKLIFDRNKSYMIPIGVIFICVVLFFQFVIPQFNMIFIARQQSKEALLKLAALKENLRILSNIDDVSLNSQLEVLTRFLPAAKDFDGILNSINSSAQNAGADLGSFSFHVGDLSKTEGTDKFPTIKLSVPINSGISSVSNFIQVISKKMPLSEVSLVRIGGKSSMINLSFYYKPLDSSGRNEVSRINSVSQKGLLLIEKLKNFGNESRSSAGE